MIDKQTEGWISWIKVIRNSKRMKTRTIIDQIRQSMNQNASNVKGTLAVGVRRVVRWLVCAKLKLHKWKQVRSGNEHRQCALCGREQYNPRAHDEHGNWTGWFNCK